jgi:hypothetical protein
LEDNQNSLGRLEELRRKATESGSGWEAFADKLQAHNDSLVQLGLLYYKAEKSSSGWEKFAAEAKDRSSETGWQKFAEVLKSASPKANGWEVLQKVLNENQAKLSQFKDKAGKSGWEIFKHEFESNKVTLGQMKEMGEKVAKNSTPCQMVSSENVICNGDVFQKVHYKGVIQSTANSLKRAFGKSGGEQGVDSSNSAPTRSGQSAE